MTGDAMACLLTEAIVAINRRADDIREAALEGLRVDAVAELDAAREAIATAVEIAATTKTAKEGRNRD